VSERSTASSVELRAALAQVREAVIARRVLTDSDRQALAIVLKAAQEWANVKENYE